MAVTKSGGAVKFYLDGNEHVVPINYAPGFTFTSDLRMSPPGELPGRVDEIEFFDRTLAQAELLAIFNAGPAGKCPPGRVALFIDEFDADPVGEGADRNPSQWQTPAGAGLVDLLGPSFFGGPQCVGGGGKCIDLVGSPGGPVSGIETVAVFDLTPGFVYTLTYRLGGTSLADPDPVGTVNVFLGPAMRSHSLPGGAPYQQFTLTFTPSQATSGRIVFQHVQPGVDSWGHFLDSVVLLAEPVLADADGDGVPDGIDQCPGTPAGQPVDAAGCALAQRTFTLTVLLDGPPLGAVTSDDGGIACPPDCDHPYPGGTPVTLRAAARRGAAFAGFTGGCTTDPSLLTSPPTPPSPPPSPRPPTAPPSRPPRPTTPPSPPATSSPSPGPPPPAPPSTPSSSPA